MKQQTPILIFSRSATAESSVKKLHSNAEQNLLLHHALYNNTMLAVKATGLPFILVDEVLQKGNNFGEKYCNALEYCFSKGFKKIISVGTDCSTLTTEILLNANLFSCSKNLIGADNNGGFYLFALHKKNYNRHHYLSFCWCTSNLLKDIFSFFKNNNLSKITLIQSENDINSGVDFVKAIKEKNASALIKLLFQLFNSINIEIIFPLLKVINNSLHPLLLRGPPPMVVITL